MTETGHQSLVAMKSRGRDGLIAGVLAILTFLTFFPATRCNFVNLDDYSIVLLPQVSEGLTAKNVRWSFSTVEQGFYFPFTWLSFQLDAQLYGLEPRGYHLTNILLHTANTGLLFWFLLRATGSTWRSAAVAAVFGIHPLRVESVAWVTERKDVLCGFFGFLTLIAYVHYVRRPNWRAFACVFVLYVFSLLCKSMLAALPGVLLVLDFWPLKRFQPVSASPNSATAWQLNRHLLAEKIVLALPAVALTMVSAIALKRSGVLAMERAPLPARIANAFVSYGQYILKSVWFRDLAVWYPLRTPSPLLAGAAGMGLLLVTLLVLCKAHERPWLAAGWMWYLLALVPTLALPLIAWATRFSYFPTIGLLVMAFWSLPDVTLLPRWRLAYAGGIVLVVVVLCAATRIQIGFWKDSVTLWEHDLQVVPGEAFAERSLLGDLSDAGRILHDHGDISGAIKVWRRGVELNPRSVDFHGHLVEDLSSEGRIAEATDCCLAALLIEPQNADMHYRLAGLLLKTGKLGEATARYRRALAIDPRFVKAHAALGAALCRQGLPGEGAAEFIEALRLNPSWAEAHDGLGMILLSQGKLADATRHFVMAVRLSPDCARCHNNLGVALAQQGDLDTAIVQFELAVHLDPGYKGAKENLDRMRMERERSRVSVRQ